MVWPFSEFFGGVCCGFCDTHLFPFFIIQIFDYGSLSSVAFPEKDQLVSPPPLRRCHPLLLAAVSAIHRAANSLRWRLRLPFCGASAFCLLAHLLLLSTGAFTSAFCRASASCHTSALRWAPLVRLVVTFPRVCLRGSLLSRLCLAPRPPPFIMPPPFIAPLLFGWLSHCPASQPPSCCDSAWCLGLRLLLHPCL